MSSRPNLASERGAILVQAFLALMLLFGIATFVVDYGLLWVSRHQAQNAADAGAIAGAIGRAYDDFDDPPAPGGIAVAGASQAARANLVWGEEAAVSVPSTTCPAEIASGRCVRVDVHRDAANSNKLPNVFSPVWSLVLPPVSQNVRATATARALVSNATDCLRPWAIPDKWTGGSYSAGGPYAGPPTNLYTPPGPGGPGIGGLRFPVSNAGKPASDLDATIPALSFADLRMPANPILRGSVVPLDLDTGYFPSVSACNSQIVSIGASIPLSTAPTVASAADLDALPLNLVSPRLVAVAVFDVEAFRFQRSIAWIGCPTPGIPCVSIVNIVGLVVGGGGASGVITTYPGLLPTDPLEPPKLTAASSFLKAVTLVR